MNSVLGALLAALITLGTGATALLTGEVCVVVDGEEVCRSVTRVSDISQLQWIILGIGAGVGFLKDWQAITVRRQIDRITNTGDGGI